MILNEKFICDLSWETQPIYELVKAYKDGDNIRCPSSWSYFCILKQAIMD